MAAATQYSLLRRLAVMAGLACLLPVAGAQPSSPVVEYRVKAAYLYNFTKFIDWPSRAFAEDAPVFVLGVLDPEGRAHAAISEALTGKSTDEGRTIEVRRLSGLEDVAHGHQVFASRASGVTPEQLSAAAGGRAVLLVGETENFAPHGGTIGLVLAGDAVRCEINLAAAERSGLKLSGRLASISRLVREVSRR